MKIIFKNKLFLLLLAILIFAVSYLLHHSFNEGTSPTISDFETTLHKKEHKLMDEMQALAKRASSKSYNQLFTDMPSNYNSMLVNEGIALLLYENDTLKFWNDNSIAVENWIKEICLDTKMVKLHNGWFEVMRPPTNANSTKTIVGLILIKNEYPYQNKYLVNEFQKDFAVPAETKLTIDNINSPNKVINLEGDFLFSLEFNPTINPITATTYFTAFLSILAGLLLILFLKINCFSLQNKTGKNYSIILFVVLVVVLRFLSIKLLFPDNLYSFELFNPKVFANASSVWLSSLGDLLINTILLFYLSITVLKNVDFDILFLPLKKTNKVVISFFLFLAFFGLSWIITELFIGIINNSNIPFGINNLFGLNQYSLVAVIIIGILLFVYFLWADKMVLVLKQFQLTNSQYLFIFILSTSIQLLIYNFLGTLDLIVIILPVLVVVSIALIKRKESNYPFSGIVLMVFIFSIYAVHIFIKHSGIKEMEIRKIYAEKLSAEQDPVAELLFQDVEEKLKRDFILSSFINGIEKQPSEFEKRLKQQYFSGFWEKYDVHIALFDSMCVPVIKSQNPVFDNNFYFDELIAKKGKPTSRNHFNFINNESGKISYLAKIPFNKSPATTAKFGTLYIELDAKFISDEIGFPELLLDRNIGLSEELTNYSYAKYKQHELINQYGKFSYGLTDKDFAGLQGEFNVLDKDGYNHLVYRPNTETLIALSIRNEGLIGEITTFSYLFAFFSLLLLSILFLRQLSSRKLFYNFNFKYRIQVLLVLIVLVSLTLFGGGTIYYIKQQFEVQNQESIGEKIHSVLIDVESKLSSENILNNSMVDYVSFILKKSSSVFFTDINFYDAKGNLYASSRSKVFDEGLTSKKMNPEAFLQMAILGKTDFVHDEWIGKLNYLSAYIPFRNKDGKLLAYLNLPYFAKQNKLEKEISGFLVALINIYVLMFALSIITAILISNYVTKPLKLIGDKLSNIKLGKANEPIEWSEKDEIGGLVSEYNRMISELAKSAELLAKSERESAWREMAKQVAHEIKNPLTPMKLSVQHLQRTWKDHAPDMDEKLERLTKTIIEQIDTLSTIANEFSNFANMPKVNLEKINIQELMVNCIGLYKDAHHVHIDFINEIIQQHYVLADKEQLIRVFNNLLKNAIQAIPDEREGIIKVTLKTENNFIVIGINDNGVGIDKEALHKIFTPNFTTKTGGMGLGLAMVKHIVETVNGKIWFETKIGLGSTFYVMLPVYDDMSSNS